jgi:signal transduction histidine kinase/CheY-like chemotaxis protein
VAPQPAANGHRELYALAIRDGLAPASLVCGLWYAGLVFVHLAGLAGPARTHLAAAAALTAATFLGLSATWWRQPPPAEHTDRCIALTAFLILANNVYGVWHLRDPAYATGFYLEIVALGIVVLSHRWFAGLVAATLGGFFVGAARAGFGADWWLPTIVAAGSTVLATCMHLVLGSYRRRLEALGSESEARGRELEASLAELRGEVSHRERLQSQLARSQRLESLGLLAGGIAHDFNNLLAIVVGHASLLLGRSAGPDQRESLQAILDAGDRAQLLSAELLAYAGRRERRAVPLDLAQEIAAIVELARRGLPAGVTLALEPAAGPSFALADRAQLQQVALNLLVNAADATRERGGRVGVQVGARELSASEASELEPAASRPGGPYTFVRVSDDGCGMDADTLAHVFDPFFSTKGAGRGLGLAAALGIARAHAGGFSVESASGSGTAFTLYLPATDARPERPAAPTAAAPARPGGELLLVVDDDDGVRATAASALRDAGHRVVEAAAGRAAVDALRTTPEIALAVVDMTMPGMSGEETLHALRALRADLPILLSSGYDVHEAASRLVALPGVAFLPKPYRASEIAACTRALLDARPAA